MSQRARPRTAAQAPFPPGSHPARVRIKVPPKSFGRYTPPVHVSCAAPVPALTRYLAWREERFKNLPRRASEPSLSTKPERPERPRTAPITLPAPVLLMSRDVCVAAPPIAEPERPAAKTASTTVQQGTGTGWLTAQTKMAAKRKADEAQKREQSAAALTAAKAKANAAWDAGEFEACARALTEAISLCPSAVLYQYRARAAGHSKGGLPAALADAGRAVELAPGSPATHQLHSHYLARSRSWAAAGVALGEATRLGAPDGSDDCGLNPLLDAIRRERVYANLGRAPSRKAFVSSSLALSPWRANIFDPRHLKSMLAQGDDDGAADPPAPPTLWLVDVAETTIAVGFAPQAKDEQSIDGYELQMAPFDVSFDGSDVIERFLPFERVARLPEDARQRTVSELRPSRRYRLRLRAQTSVYGEWSNEVEATTTANAFAGAQVMMPVPPRWLDMDVSDLYSGLECSATDFTAECAVALLPFVRNLKSLFAMLSVSGGKGLTRQAFAKFVKDMGLQQGLGSGGVDLLFQRANASAGDGGTHGGDNGGLNTMVEHEFVNGLVRLAWASDLGEGHAGGRGGIRTAGGDEGDDRGGSGAARGGGQRGDSGAGHGGRKHGNGRGHGTGGHTSSSGGGSNGIGVGDRIDHLLRDVVMPRSAHLLSHGDDSFLREWHTSARLEAINDHFRPFLLEVFQVYSRADVTINQAKGHLATMNHAELLFLCKEGQLLDERLTLLGLTTLFRRINTDAAATGVDDNTAELSFDEFMLMLGQMANAKFPPETRSGEAFDATWQSFLTLLFVPRFRKLLKAKRQGAGRQTIDGKCF